MSSALVCLEQVTPVTRDRLEQRAQVLARMEERLSLVLDAGPVHERHAIEEPRIEAKC